MDTDQELGSAQAGSSYTSAGNTGEVENMFQRSFHSEEDSENFSSDEDSTDDDIPGDTAGFYDDDAVMAQIQRKGKKSRSQNPTSDETVRTARRGPLKALEPGQDFKDQLSEATSAFIDADYVRATTLVKRAIHLNPEIFAAHSLLSEIFLAQDQKQKALAALFSGAHTRPRDPAVWLNVAELVLKRSGDDRVAALQDVLYCYSRVIEIDQKRYLIRFERAAVYRELGYNGRAVQEYERLLKDLPHNTRALRNLAEICIELNDVDKAKANYDECIAYYTRSNFEEAQDFNWSDVNIYIELFAYENEYEEGVISLKRLARWILGRKADTKWDSAREDDREWDAENYPRRLETPWFIPDEYPLESYGLGLPLELRIKLGVYRLKLGIEYKDEALSHFDWLEPENISPDSILFNYGDLFREAADALKESQLHDDALRFYVPLQHTPEHAETSLFLSMAECYDACQNEEEAERCYLTVAEYDATNIEARAKLAKFYEKMGLVEQALKYVTEAEDIGRHESMPRRNRRVGSRIEQLANEFRAAESELSRAGIPGEENDLSVSVGDHLFPERSGPMTLTSSTATASKERKTAETDARAPDGGNVRYLYKKFVALRPYMREGNENATEDWLDIAYALLRDFRSNRVFFPIQKRMTFLGYSKEAQRKAGRLKTPAILNELEQISERLHTAMGTLDTEAKAIPNDYYGISFDDWLDIFLEYALVLAGQKQGDEAYDALGAAADASIWYHSKERNRQIHVCWFACAMLLKDEEGLTTIARWFMKEYQFVTDTYRLFATLSRAHGNPKRSLFHSSPSMKFMLRQVKAIDYSLPADPLNPIKPALQERASLSTKDAGGNYIPASDMDVALLVLYGHILYAGTSFTNALNYFFRAFALDPENPAVLLSIGLSYIHHSLKRQSDNRHYLIMEGLSFMQEYRRIRGSSSVVQERQEVEFNCARVWHMLGLAHLAIEGYNRCLELGKEIDLERRSLAGLSQEKVWVEDFSHEAAYALQCLCSFSGETGMANKVTKEWLVI